MKTELFNIVVNSIRNFATLETDDRIQIPLTNMHRLQVVLDAGRKHILYIDLERVTADNSFSKSIYCRTCPVNLFTPAQIKIMEDLIHGLSAERQSNISAEFNKILGIR